MYRCVYPQAQRDSYKENDNVDFMINVGEGNSLMPNSVRFSGKLAVTSNGSKVNNVTDISFDSKSGIHGFFSSINTSSNVGNMENFVNYGRWVHIKNEARETKIMNVCEADKNVELRMATDEQTKVLMAGRVDEYENGAEASSGVIDFTFSPDICLNNMSGAMAFSKSGAIRVSLRLAPVSTVLFGSASDLSYSITDLKCHYMASQTVNNGDVVMVVKKSMNNIVSSANQEIQTRVPMLVDTVSVSFIKSTNLNSQTTNKYASERLPSVSSVEWAVNDINGYVSFPFYDEGEVMLNYLQSLGSGKYNDIRDSNSTGYGIGLRFPAPRNFTNSKLGLNIRSGVQNEANAFTAYLFFQGLMKF